MTKISIIIPVYNVAEYLPQCLESVINQTLKDIEIICINDGSTDNSLEILREYEKKDGRIKIIDKENEGVSAARNKGIEVAHGEYLLFCDGDDWIETDTCEEVYKKIKFDNADMLIFNHYIIDKHEKKKAKYLKNIKNNIFYFNQCSKDFYYILSSAHGKLYRNKKDKIYFPEDISFGEDTVYFWHYCFQNPKITIYDKPLYNYLQRNNSAMKKEMSGGSRL